MQLNIIVYKCKHFVNVIFFLFGVFVDTLIKLILVHTQLCSHTDRVEWIIWLAGKAVSDKSADVCIHNTHCHVGRGRVIYSHPFVCDVYDFVEYWIGLTHWFEIIQKLIFWTSRTLINRFIWCIVADMETYDMTCVI